MTDGATCVECDVPVSYATGFTMTGVLGDASQDQVWCPLHAPNHGTGYTLADLRKWRDDNQITKAQRQMQLMDQVGADVYFNVTDHTTPPAPEQR